MTDHTPTVEPAGSSAPSARPRPIRRLASIVRWGGDIGAVALLAGAIVGFYLRDRWLPLAVLTYMPLAPAAGAVLAWDLLRRGRTLRRLRFVVSLVAIVFVVIGVRWMWATQPLDHPQSEEGSPVRLVHWNVRWGGGFHESGRHWEPIAQELAAHEADVIVLAESPMQFSAKRSDWVFADGWSAVRWLSKIDSNYAWSVVVTSRWPVRELWRRQIPDGIAMRIDADTPAGPLRLLVVDGMSDPRRDRPAFLGAIARIAEDAAAQGEPIHAIVGDFNAVSRSIGFDAFEADPLNMRLAARHGGGWRGTGPAVLPVLDVDHAWLAPSVRLFDIHRFTRWPSDHVGYVLTIHP